MTRLCTPDSARFVSEDLQCQLLRKFSDILLEAQDLHNKHLDTLKSRVAAASAASKAVDPSRDQDLFIDHNIRAFVAPPDFQFEPCGIHYDTVCCSISSIFAYNTYGIHRVK